MSSLINQPYNLKSMCGTIFLSDGNGSTISNGTINTNNLNVTNFSTSNLTVTNNEIVGGSITAGSANIIGTLACNDCSAAIINCSTINVASTSGFLATTTNNNSSVGGDFAIGGVLNVGGKTTINELNTFGNVNMQKLPYSYQLTPTLTNQLTTKNFVDSKFSNPIFTGNLTLNTLYTSPSFGQLGCSLSSIGSFVFNNTGFNLLSIVSTTFSSSLPGLWLANFNFTFWYAVSAFVCDYIQIGLSSSSTTISSPLNNSTITLTSPSITNVAPKLQTSALFVIDSTSFPSLYIVGNCSQSTSPNLLNVTIVSSLTRLA